MNVDTDKIVVNWPDVGEQPNYHEVNERLQDASDSIWANTYQILCGAPAFGRKLVTVHPVGGCPMGNTARQGVVNDGCQVFSETTGTKVHEGLYVCDGAVIPSSVGLNPLLTITAISERAMDILVRETPHEVAQLLESSPQCIAIAPLKIEETPEPPITEKLEDIIKMFKGWDALIEMGDYKTARTEIRDTVMGYFEAGESPEIHKKLLTNIKSRILALGLDVGLTKGELVSDIAPALTYVTEILEGVNERVAKDDARGAAKYLEDNCGDFSPDLAFSETMRGFMSLPLPTESMTLSDPYQIAAKYGEAAGNPIRGDFRIVADSLKKLTDLEAHEANLTGEITCPLINDATLTIQDGGKFNCLIAQEGKVETWKMVYACVVRGGGKDYYFHGFKTLARRPGSNWWTDLTTLSVDIYEGDRPDKNRLMAKGVMTLGVQDLLKQLSTVTTEFQSEEDNTILTTLTADALLWGDLNSDLKDPKRREKLLRKLVGLLALAKHSQLTTLVSFYFLSKFGAFFGMLVSALTAKCWPISTTSPVARWRKAQSLRCPTPMAQGFATNPTSTPSPIPSKRQAVSSCI